MAFFSPLTAHSCACCVGDQSLWLHCEFYKRIKINTYVWNSAFPLYFKKKNTTSIFFCICTHTILDVCRRPSLYTSSLGWGGQVCLTKKKMFALEHAAFFVWDNDVFICLTMFFCFLIPVTKRVALLILLFAVRTLSWIKLNWTEVKWIHLNWN